MGSMTEYVLYGPKEDVPEIRESLGEKHLTTLLLHHDKVAQIQELDGVEVTVTHGELLRRAKAVTGLLRAHGLGSGGTVMLSCGNTLEYAPIMVGTFFVGAAVAPVNPAYGAADMLHFLEVLQPQVVISNKCGEASLQEALAQYKLPVPFLTMEEVQKCMMEEDQVMDKEFELGLVEDIKTHVALVMCSSGTTGKPKSVEITQEFLLRPPGTTINPNAHKPVILNMIGPFWISCQASTMSALLFGGKLVIFDKFDVEHFFSTIQKYKVTKVLISPPHLPLIAEFPSTEHYDVSSLTILDFGGAPAPLELLARVEKKFRRSIHVRYAMTESLLMLRQDKEVQGKPGNVGKVNGNTAAKVVDIETGKLLGPNTQGELCFRTELRFKGYRHNPVATKEMFDEDGFMHTGDIGYYDNDGHFFVVDRIKDIYKCFGIHVTGCDAEGVLLRHPGVIEAAVVGIPNEVNAKATAFVVKRPGSKVVDQDLDNMVKETLPNYKWLYGGIRFVDSLPKTHTGKVQKYMLRKLAQG